MYRNMIAASLALCVAVATGACNRDQEKMTTAADVQTQSPAQPANTPTTIAGCVKAGEAADTYVLTTARAEGSGEAATYQLVGDQAAALREQIGRRVEVSGTMEAQQETASRSTAQPEERPTGTSGTPTVRTKAEIEIRRLSVTSVNPLGEKCDS